MLRFSVLLCECVTLLSLDSRQKAGRKWKDENKKDCVMVERLFQRMGE